ncbi:pro-FMRFamide-related neuropeptide VF [Phascolarctos cinereus]|uniref:Pro-FMRFamide-related neuropeptide VF n=1 Tax=Phascolarctos cinereus TaxID=38626 RepID=A0A6P5KT63_PHACI|nr:pro-FMRFamide-related neuropeptide VF [Phascolarctos cinereus]
MEIISLKPFVILTLATSILLASKSICADESMMSNLHDWEHYDEYLKPIGRPKEKKQRSLSPAELWQWGSNTIHKMQTPITYKIPQAMPPLPLRFGRSSGEERSAEPVANLALRFGRNFNGGILRRIPNLPQRFGRAAVKSVKESIIHWPQRLLGSPSAEQQSHPVARQPWELQAADEGEPRTLGFDDYFTKKADDNEVSPEEWEVWREAPDPKVM